MKFTTERVIHRLGQIHLLYLCLLPGLATGAAMFLPGVQPWVADHPTAVLFLWMLALGVVAFYLGVSLEMVELPNRLGAALFATLGVPVQLIVLALLPGSEAAGALVVGFVAECVGLMTYLMGMAVNKMVREDKNWSAFFTVALGWVGALGFAFFLGRSLYSGLLAWIVFATTIFSEIYTYHKLIQQGSSNPKAMEWILLGVISWLALPGLALLVVVVF